MENMSVELVVDNEVVNVPEEINIGMYQQINLNPVKYKNPLQLISLFTNMTVHELKNLQKDQVELIEGFLSSRLVFPDDNKLVMTFEHNGIEYGLENDWSKLAFGAWVDFEVYCSDDKIYDNLHKIMAVLYRPVISQDKKNPLKYKIAPYKSEEIEERAEIMKLVPVSIWLGASVFFLEIVNIYITSIKNSLELTLTIQEKTTKAWKMMPKWIQKVLPLDFISPSLTGSQKKMLQNLIK
jgi:hypothetical protein